MARYPPDDRSRESISAPRAHRGDRARRRAAIALAPPTARAQRMLVPMDDGQTNHLKAYGLTYSAIKAGMQAEWLLNYRGGAFLLPDAPELRRRAEPRRHLARAGERRAARGDPPRDRRRQHGERAAGEGAEDRRLLAARRAAVGRRRHARAQVRRHRVHARLRRRGGARRPVEVRLAAPAPRGLHGPVQQVPSRLSRRALVPRARREEPGDGEAARLRHRAGAQEGRRREDPAVRRARRIPVRDVRRDGDARAGDRRPRRRHRRRVRRRHARGSERRREDALARARSRSRTRTSSSRRS